MAMSLADRIVAVMGVAFVLEVVVLLAWPAREPRLANRRDALPEPQAWPMIAGEPLPLRHDESLRIVSDDLWKRAHDRLAQTRQAYDRRSGVKPSGALESTYLLSGMLKCGICGSNLVVSGKRAGGKYPDAIYYVCSAQKGRGKVSCPNNRGVRVSDLHDAVIASLKDVVLQESVLTGLLYTIRDARREKPEAMAAQRATLQAEIDRLDQERANLVRLAALTSDMTVVAGIEERRKLRDEAAAKLEHLDALAAEGESLVSLSIEDMPALRKELEAEAPAARRVLRRLLLGPITVTPKLLDAKGRRVAFEFEGKATYAVLDRMESRSFSTVSSIRRLCQRGSPR